MSSRNSARSTKRNKEKPQPSKTSARNSANSKAGSTSASATKTSTKSNGKRRQRETTDDDSEPNGNEHIEKGRKRQRRSKKSDIESASDTVPESELHESIDGMGGADSEAGGSDLEEDSNKSQVTSMFTSINGHQLTQLQDGGVDPDDTLEPRHCSSIPSAKPVKKESTKDLLLMMSDRVKVKFKVRDNEYQTISGRWCLTCK